MGFLMQDSDRRCNLSKYICVVGSEYFQALRWLLIKNAARFALGWPHRVETPQMKQCALYFHDRGVSTKVWRRRQMHPISTRLTYLWYWFHMWWLNPDFKSVTFPFTCPCGERVCQASRVSGPSQSACELTKQSPVPRELHDFRLAPLPCRSSRAKGLV